MRLIDATNAEAYLRETGRVSPGERVTVRELAGGVSNIVLLVEFPGGERRPFVLKQAREQLRVAQPWFCSPERIWREVEVLQTLAQLALPSVGLSRRISTPQVLFTDPNTYLFGMTAAPTEAVTWKQLLLAGKVDLSIAAACGSLMGSMHAQTWQRDDVARKFASRQFFVALRVDPYYRQIAQVHTAITPTITGLIASLDDNLRCLVHGDFSPKNLLVSEQELMLIDCEVGHYGDPAFDLGFFLSHLQLKAIHLGDESLIVAREKFCEAYRAIVAPVIGPQELQALNDRLEMNLAACMLARVDGKSPVEYLTEEQRSEVRQFALQLLSPHRLMTSRPIQFF